MKGTTYLVYGGFLMQHNIWDFWAGRYEKLWVQKYSLKPTRELVIAQLKKHIGPNKKVKGNLLDIGCGTGQLLTELEDEFKEFNLSLTGIDSSKQMVVFAHHKLTNANANANSNVEVLVGDALNLPFADSQFDFLTCCHSFPYYPDKLKALREFKRVLKPEGFLFLVQASENSVYDKVIMKLVKLTTGRASYPSKAQIRELAEAAGFNLVEQKRLESEFFMPSIILSTIQNGDEK